MWWDMWRLSSLRWPLPPSAVRGRSARAQGRSARSFLGDGFECIYTVKTRDESENEECSASYYVSPRPPARAQQAHTFLRVGSTLENPHSCVDVCTPQRHPPSSRLLDGRRTRRPLRRAASPAGQADGTAPL